MRNIKFKKLSLILVIILLIISISTISSAQLTNIRPGTTAGTEDIKTIAGKILGVVQVIGVAVAVIVLVVLAMKYITAAPGEKADVKKSLFTFTIGALLLFGGVALLNIVASLGGSINSGSTAAQIPPSVNTGIRV